MADTPESPMTEIDEFYARHHTTCNQFPRLWAVDEFEDVGSHRIYVKCGLCGAQTYEDVDVDALSDWLNAITDDDTGDHTLASAVQAAIQRIKN